MSKLLVGAGKATIDPTKDMYPMPTRFNVADALYDSCYCRVIAIDNGDIKVLMLIYEVSDYPMVPNLLAKVAEATGFAEENIILTFTHNHTSPCDEANHSFGGDESQELDAKRKKFMEIELAATIDAAKKAVETMRPAKCGFGTIDSYVNVNRDFNTFGGFWVESQNQSGFSDKTLSVLKFVDADGKLIAAFMNHGTHSTCAFLQKDADHKIKTSSNFSGIACKFAEQYYNDEAVIAWSAGAAGNQNPIMSHGLRYEYPDGYTASVPYPDGVGYMQMESVGRIHGGDAVKCIESIKSYKESFPIKLVKKTVLLPAQKRVPNPSGQRAAVRMDNEGLRDWDAIPYGKSPAVPDLSNVVEPAPESPLEMRMDLLLLGDVALILTNGELYAELGSRIKAESPYSKTVVATYSQAKSTGYIMDKSSVNHKVFQAFSRVIPGGSDELIAEVAQELYKEALK